MTDRATLRERLAEWRKRLRARRARLRLARRRLARAAKRVAELERRIAAAQPARGIDVSVHQGAIVESRVKAAGYRFVWCKATEGEGFVDARFLTNIAGARRAGLQVGAYHFLRPRPGRTGAAEADDFIRQLRAARIGKGDLLPVVDVEVTDLARGPNTQAYVGSFARALEHKLGVRPLIYTFPAFMAWTSTLGCRLWIAHFDVARPTIPAPWRSYAAWQHSSSATVPGVSGRCDVNRCPDLRLITW